MRRGSIASSRWRQAKWVSTNSESSVKRLVRRPKCHLGYVGRYRRTSSEESATPAELLEPMIHPRRRSKSNLGNTAQRSGSRDSELWDSSRSICKAHPLLTKLPADDPFVLRNIYGWPPARPVPSGYIASHFSAGCETTARPRREMRRLPL